MTVYEYKGNVLAAVFALIFLVLIALFIIGAVYFFPLIKATVVFIKDTVGNNSNYGVDKNTAIQIIFSIIVSIIIYGIFAVGIVFFSLNAADSVSYYIDTKNATVVSGQLQNVQYEEFEYRGNILGYGLTAEVDGNNYVVSIPPGISAQKKEIIKSGQNITIQYKRSRGVNEILRIEILVGQ